MVVSKLCSLTAWHSVFAKVAERHLLLFNVKDLPKAVTFFPFLMSCTRTHFRIAELAASLRRRLSRGRCPLRVMSPMWHDISDRSSLPISIRPLFLVHFANRDSHC